MFWSVWEIFIVIVKFELYFETQNQLVSSIAFIVENNTKTKIADTSIINKIDVFRF